MKIIRVAKSDLQTRRSERKSVDIKVSGYVEATARKETVKYEFYKKSVVPMY